MAVSKDGARLKYTWHPIDKEEAKAAKAAAFENGTVISLRGQRCLDHIFENGWQAAVMDLLLRYDGSVKIFLIQDCLAEGLYAIYEDGGLAFVFLSEEDISAIPKLPEVPFDVVISYAIEDYGKALLLKTELEAQGVTSFIYENSSNSLSHMWFFHYQHILTKGAFFVPFISHNFLVGKGTKA